MRSVFLLGLYEKRFFTLGWTLSLAAFAALMVAFFPSLSSQGALDVFAEGMPKEFEGLVGNLADLQQFSTYLASQLFDIRSSIIIGVLAVLLGVSLGMSDESSGRLRTLLALPISRTSYLLQRVLVLVVIMAIATLGLVGGIYASMPFVEGAELASGTLWQLAAMTWLIGVVLGMVPLALGAATGSKSIATIGGVLVLVFSYLISVIGMAVDWIADVAPLTPFHYFPPVEIVKNGVDILDVLVLGGAVIVLTVVSLVLFRRRDVA